MEKLASCANENQNHDGLAMPV